MLGGESEGLVSWSWKADVGSVIPGGGILGVPGPSSCCFHESLHSLQLLPLAGLSTVLIHRCGVCPR